MATRWSDYENRLRVGIDFSHDSSVTQASPTVAVTVKLYAQTNYTTYNYDVDSSWKGDWSGSSTDRLSNSTSKLIYSGSKKITASYDAPKSYAIAIGARGTGAGPVSISRTGTIAQRPTADPTTAGSPSASSITTTSAKLTWSGPSDWNGPGEGREYNFQLSTTASTTGIVQQGRLASGNTVQGLQPATRYYVRVRAVGLWWDANRYGPYSSWTSFRTDYETPAAIGGRIIRSRTATSVDFGWNAVTTPGAEGVTTTYELELRESSDATARVGTIVASRRVSTTSSVFTGLKPGTNYVLHARANNGKNGYWNVDYTGGVGHLVKTLASPPTMANYSTTSISRSAATVTGFSISNSGGEMPSDVRVQFGLAAAETGLTTITKGSVASVQLTGLAPATTYYYRAAAYNSGGWGAYGPWRSFKTLSTSPDEPAAPTVSAITEKTATVSWSAPALNGATITGYTVAISANDDPDNPELTVTVGSSVLTANISGLSKATDYYASVRANATPESSGYSPGRKFRSAGSLSSDFWVKDGATWRRVKLWVKDGSTWREAVPWTRVSGTWKVGV